MTQEQYLDKQIMLYCGEHNWLCFHCNVGQVLTANGTYFRTGLPVGFPDLLVIQTDGKVAFCETKIHPRKPTKEQVAFLTNLQERGFTAFVAYSLDEFIEKIGA